VTSDPRSPAPVSLDSVVDTPVRWPVRDTRVRYSGPIATVRTDTVAMPGDGTAERDVVEHPGAVGVIALDEEGRVLVLQQYRHAVGRLLWEPPAGILDVRGEPPLQAAKRELYEEAHQQASDWRVLVDAFTTPGISDESVRIFLARDLSDAAEERYARVHEEADMPLAWVSLEVLVHRILDGRLHNPMMVMGVLALRAALVTGELDDLRRADAPWPEQPGSTLRP
jgi:8-oxo-dGTP pyrophosphatase MutT (NUDIX family)